LAWWKKIFFIKINHAPNKDIIFSVIKYHRKDSKASQVFPFPSIIYILKEKSLIFHKQYRTHPLTSTEAVECLFQKITDFVAITSIGCT
jgi:hypothetical protein